MPAISGTSRPAIGFVESGSSVFGPAVDAGFACMGAAVGASVGAVGCDQRPVPLTELVAKRAVTSDL